MQREMMRQSDAMKRRRDNAIARGAEAIVRVERRDRLGATRDRASPNTWHGVAISRNHCANGVSLDVVGRLHGAVG
jgi:hypothetical protein